ncbi:MAG: hypothetical protein V4539_11055 [Bacteroidota bacterium]
MGIFILGSKLGEKEVYNSEPKINGFIRGGPVFSVFSEPLLTRSAEDAVFGLPVSDLLPVPIDVNLNFNFATSVDDIPFAKAICSA